MESHLISCLRQWSTPFASFHLYHLLALQPEESLRSPEQKFHYALAIEHPHIDDVIFKDPDLPLDPQPLPHSSYYTQIIVSFSRHQWDQWTSREDQLRSPSHAQSYLTLLELLKLTNHTQLLFERLSHFCLTLEEHHLFQSLLPSKDATSEDPRRL